MAARDKKELKFPCPITDCDFRTNNKYRVADHIGRRHRRNRTRDFECVLCGKAFFTKGSLQNHIITHTKEKVFQCDQCAFTTGSRSALGYHQGRVHQGCPPRRLPKIGKHKCDLCGYRAHCPSRLQDHIRTHGSENPFACGTKGCTFTTKTKKSLRLHHRQHTKENLFKCSYEGCYYEGVTRSYLNQHVRYIHTKDRTFQCGQCTYKTVYPSHLKTHQRTHVKENGEQLRRNTPRLLKHKCKFCDYRSAYYYNLVRHARIHTGEEPFACTVQGCNYTSTCQSNVVRHQQTHAELLTKLYKCDKCEFQTRNKESFRYHVRAHADERPFACNFPGCTFRSNWSTGLRMHKKTHFSQIESNQLACPFPNCNLKTIHKGYLKIHLKIHSNDKTYSSDLCDYRGKTGGHLYSHKRIRHRANSNRNIESPLCNNIFFTKEAMKMYERTHTEERHFKCPHADCNYAAVCCSDLRHHSQERHSEEGPFHCDSQ